MGCVAKAKLKELLLLSWLFFVSIYNMKIFDISDIHFIFHFIRDRNISGEVKDIDEF